MGGVSSKDNALPTTSSSTRSATQTVGTPYGYFIGGYFPAKSTVDRIDYSNDTATAAVKGPLNFGGYAFTATGNLSYGYFAGGYGPSNKTLVDRIDYSNDTATATAKGPLAVAERERGATGTTSYG